MGYSTPGRGLSLSKVGMVGEWKEGENGVSGRRRDLRGEDSSVGLSRP